jgi:hypothetical protein
MKLAYKVIAAFFIWTLLGALIGFLNPNVDRRFYISIICEPEPNQFDGIYTNIVSNLVTMGLRAEPEIIVPTKRETRFTGTLGNLHDIKISVSLGTRPSSTNRSVQLNAQYSHPRWKDGGSADHNAFRNRLSALLQND